MNDKSSPAREDLADRLIDLALVEKVGGKMPPDLSAAILARAQDKLSLPEARPSGAIRQRPVYWSYLVSGCLLAVATLCAVVFRPDVVLQPLASVSRPRVDTSQTNAAPLSEEGKQEKLAQLVENFNELIDQQRYAEAEVLARQAQVLDGESPVAQTMLWKSRFVRRIQLPKDMTEERFHDALKALDDVSGPFPNDPPIVYPDAKVWDELTIRRKKYSQAKVFPVGDLVVPLSPSGMRTKAVFSTIGEARIPDPAAVKVPVQPAEPDPAGDKFNIPPENEFEKVTGSPLSTFSIDVDTASYSKVRQFLLHANQLPPPDAVRLEELINYFPYGYAGPADEDKKPFAAHVEVAACPWNSEHRLVRIGLKGKVIEEASRPACNLVFLVDVSGSMDGPNRLPLVIQSLKMLAGELAKRDRVSIVVYAGAAGMVLPPTPGDARPTIYSALSQLKAGGSTNGGEGIELAYKTAQENFIEGGVNRVILCTDGDFNVGVTSTAQLVDLAKERAQRGVFLSILGFGMGNHNDEMLEEVSNKANGNYAFIDTLAEARKVLVRQINGTLVTIAKDVKIQVEFNPAQVASYRLLGYENRMLAAEDFNDDKKDAGEIGGGHTVTALYEIVPAGLAKEPAQKRKPDAPKAEGEPTGNIDELKYQPEEKPAPAELGGELLTLKLRYKEPTGDTSTRLDFPVKDAGRRFTESSPDFQFAAAVASFGMLLRHSRHKGESTFDAVIETTSAAKGEDPHGYRAEFVELVKKAARLSKK